MFTKTSEILTDLNNINNICAHKSGFFMISGVKNEYGQLKNCIKLFNEQKQIIEYKDLH